MEQTAEGAILAGWIELPIELRDMILFWAADGSAAMTAVLPFVCQEIKQRRSSWLPVSKPSTTSTTTRRTFLTQRDINEKIAVDASGCGWLGVLQWLREMGCPFESEEIGLAAAERGHFEVLKWLDDVGYQIFGIGVGARRGHLEIVQWLLMKKICLSADWKMQMCANAARGSSCYSSMGKRGEPPDMPFLKTIRSGSKGRTC